MPSELGQLALLRQLALGGPRLTGTIPPELGRLPFLNHLELTGSHLSGAIPQELGQLNNLQHLDLSDNQLTMVPPEIGHLKYLTRLALNHHQLTALPSTVTQLPNWEVLQVAGNRLTALPSVAALRRLAHLDLRGLTWLDLADNFLTAVPTGLGAGNPWNRYQPLLPPDMRAFEYFASCGPTEPFAHLDLSGNRLTTLPRNWAGWLTSGN